MRNWHGLSLFPVPLFVFATNEGPYWALGFYVERGAVIFEFAHWEIGIGWNPYW